MEGVLTSSVIIKNMNVRHSYKCNLKHVIETIRKKATDFCKDTLTLPI